MQSVRAMLSDPGNLTPLFRAGVEDCAHASETIEECPSRDRRNPRDGCEHRFCCKVVRSGFRPLSVCRAIDLSSWTLATHGESIEPKRRLISVPRPDEAHPLFHHRKAGSTNRAPAQGAGLEIGSLHQKVRPPACAAESAELCPETPACQRFVQIADLLSLDQRCLADRVVAGSERLDFDPGTESSKAIGNAACALMDVDLDHGHDQNSVVAGAAARQTPLSGRSLVFSRSENT